MEDFEMTFLPRIILNDGIQVAVDFCGSLLTFGCAFAISPTWTILVPHFCAVQIKQFVTSMHNFGYVFIT